MVPYETLYVCCAAMYPSTSPACFQVKSLLRPATALPAVTKDPTAAGDCAACTSAGQPPTKQQKSVGMVKFSVADPDPGSDFFPSRIRTVSIPDPGSASKYFIYFNPKQWFLSSRKYDPGCSSRIPDPGADFLPIPDPGSSGQKGTGSRNWIRNTV
jgi:hypothetical protein